MKIKAFPREIESRAVTERHVGIENELEVRGVTSVLADSLSKRGIFREVHHDGGGREFTTVPIRLKSLKQVRGKQYFNEYYEFLKAETRPISSGGTHIHISILDKDHPNMESNAVALSIAFFKQFQKISGRQTHWAQSHPCSTIQEVRTRLQRYRDAMQYTWNPSAMPSRAYERQMRMLGPTTYQTLEFRGPKGSNDVFEITAWIEFMERVVKVSNKKSVHGVKFRDLLKGEHLEQYISGKFTEEQLNQTLNEKALA